MQYSPKLKKAMEEIKAIVKKYDIAAIVVLHTIEGEPWHEPDGSIHASGFSEYLFSINPSYSAASLHDDRFQVKGKAAHYSSKEERDKRMSATVNMFDHLSEWTGRMAMQAMDMHDAIKKMVENISDDPGTHTGHSQQNN